MYDNSQGVLRYRETDLGSISPEKMVVLLYERILRDLEEGANALAAADRREFNDAVIHAQNIVTELRNALDHTVGGDVAANLDALYDFIFQELLTALADQQIRHLTVCRDVLSPLLEAWRQVPAGAGDEEIRRRAREEAAPGPNPATDAPHEGPGTATGGEPVADDTHRLCVTV
jgi:flagellar protein FliS